MNRSRSPSLLLALVLLALVVFPSAACQGPGGALQQPSRAFVDASRSFHSVIGVRFQHYVNADTTLDLTTRDTLIRTVDDWDFMIRQGEAAVPPPPAPMPPPDPARPAGGGGQ